MALITVYGMPSGIDEIELVKLHDSLLLASCNPFFDINTINDAVVQIVPNIVPGYGNSGLFIKIEGLIHADPSDSAMTVTQHLELMIDHILRAVYSFAASHLPDCEWVQIIANTVLGVTGHDFVKVEQPVMA